MAFLLDTHTLLWAILDDNKLSSTAKRYVTDVQNVCYFSIASLWEMTIKHSLGALDLKMPLNECFDIITETGFMELQVTRHHLLKLQSLPNHHKDPFDRILIAQAIHENLTIITKDGIIPKYGVDTIW